MVHEVEHLVQSFGETLELGEVCLVVLTSLTTRKGQEKVVQVNGRKYRITARSIPPRVEIEPIDH